ncbi:MAG: hypothetical protein AAF600_20805 [Bacteroidota bacterium]
MSKRNIVLVLIAVVLTLVFFEVITRPDYPELFPTIVEDYKMNSKLMNVLGGYRTYEYFYNKNHLKKDTLKFQIKIIGRDKSLMCTGYAIKDELGKWQLLSKEEKVSDEI